MLDEDFSFDANSFKEIEHQNLWFKLSINRGPDILSDWFMAIFNQRANELEVYFKNERGRFESIELTFNFN